MQACRHSLPLGPENNWKKSANVFLSFLRLLVFVGMQDCKSVLVDRFVNELILCFLQIY